MVFGSVFGELLPETAGLRERPPAMRLKNFQGMVGLSQFRLGVVVDNQAVFCFLFLAI